MSDKAIKGCKKGSKRGQKVIEGFRGIIILLILAKAQSLGLG